MPMSRSFAIKGEFPASISSLMNAQERQVQNRDSIILIGKNRRFG